MPAQPQITEFFHVVPVSILILVKTLKPLAWTDLIVLKHLSNKTFLLFQRGTNPQHAIEMKRQAADYRVQPYLLALGDNQAFTRLCVVVGDSNFFFLKTVSTTSAVDLLFKTYFAFNLFYPLGWKNVFRFLETNVFNIPLSNPRESKFEEQLLMIKSTVL